MIINLADWIQIGLVAIAALSLIITLSSSHMRTSSRITALEQTVKNSDSMQERMRALEKDSAVIGQKISELSERQDRFQDAIQRFEQKIDHIAEMIMNSVAQ